MPDVLELIRELARYEKEPDAVETSTEDLLRDGFGESPYFNCLVADLDGEVVGIAIYFFTWSTWKGRPSLYLEDLYVREAARGTGLGAEASPGIGQGQGGSGKKVSAL